MARCKRPRLFTAPSRHLAQRRTAQFKPQARSRLVCKQCGWRLLSWVSRPHMAPATRVASHRHQSGGCSLCTFSLHASWHSSSKTTTIPGLSRAAGQHTHPHILSSPPVFFYAHSIHKSTTFLLNFYFTATVISHQPAFHPAPGFICTATPSSDPCHHSYTDMPTKSNPTIHIDSCSTFVGRPVGGACSSQAGGRIAYSASQAQQGQGGRARANPARSPKPM